MSETPELPPLPEPRVPNTYAPGGMGGSFTPDQISAYGRECWDAGRRAGLEEAAKLCETINHGGFGPQSYLSGLEDGSRGCANVIRAACGGTGRAKP